jgi:hypothetical protein
MMQQKNVVLFKTAAKHGTFGGKPFEGLLAGNRA